MVSFSHTEDWMNGWRRALYPGSEWGWHASLWDGGDEETQPLRASHLPLPAPALLPQGCLFSTLWAKLSLPTVLRHFQHLLPCDEHIFTSPSSFPPRKPCLCVPDPIIPQCLHACLCMHACIVHICFVHACLCMCICVCVHMCICVHTSTCMCIPCVFDCIVICVYMCVHMHVCVHVYLHVCMHACVV